MHSNDAPLVLGRINGVYGVKGWFKILSFTRPKENILQYQSLLLGSNGHWREALVEDGQQRGERLILKLAGIDTPEDAREYLGTDLGVARKQLPDLPQGQYYWHQLVGLRVDNLTGQQLGQVTDLRETGANDVLVVSATGSDRRKILIPLVMDIFVKQVDLDTGVIKVDWEQET